MTQILVSKKSLLFILPIILLFFLVYSLIARKVAPINSVDPEYIHLTSSVNLANGQYELLSIQNPGSSLYLYGGIIVKMTHLLSFTKSNLTDDFLINPLKYVLVFRISLILMNFISLIFLGLIIYKLTKDIFQCIFLQVIPFVSFSILDSGTIICPENLLVIIMIWYILLLVILTKGFIQEFKIVIFFSIIAGLGLANKLTFVPLVLPPFFLFSKNSYRFYYLALTCLITLIISFPVVLQFERFSSWVSSLIFHSGNYGTGELKIVNIHSFIINLKKIFLKEIIFSTTFIVLIITFILYIFSKKKERRTFILFLVITIVFTIQIFLTAKHFAFRYLIPSMMLCTFVLNEIIRVISDYYKRIARNQGLIFLGMTIIILGYGMVNLENYIINHRDHNNSRIGAKNFIENNLKGKPLLIVPNYFGTSTTEYALNFSAIWAGKYREQYFSRLNQFYPQSYFYFPYSDKYYKWSHSTCLFDILNRFDSLYVYVSLDATEAKEDDYNQEIKKRLTNYNNYGVKAVELTEIYRAKDDAVYRLDINRTELVRIFDFTEVKCDMERLSENKKYYETFTKDTFDYRNNQSSDIAFSGKYSQYLDKRNPWGSKIQFKDVKKDDYFEVTLWKKSHDNKCLLVASAEDMNAFYVAGNFVNQSENGWEQIELTFEVNKKIENKSICIYVWYTGDSCVYVDDFQIKHGRVRDSE